MHAQASRFLLARPSETLLLAQIILMSTDGAADVQPNVNRAFRTMLQHSFHLLAMPLGLCFVGVLVGVFLATVFLAGRLEGLFANASYTYRIARWPVCNSDRTQRTHANSCSSLSAASRAATQGHTADGCTLRLWAQMYDCTAPHLIPACTFPAGVILSHFPCRQIAS